MKRIIFGAGILLSAALLITAAGSLFAHGPGNHFMHRIASQLTGDQREEIHQTIEIMLEEGVSPCEVHETVREMVEGYGIELPDRPFGHHGLHGVLDQLTEDQRAEIHEMVEIMTDDGASPCGIHEAVREMVEGYGIELPEKHGRKHRRGMRH
jgi:hypothetical protein